MEKENKHWYLGGIYYNKEDPRIIVPKRLGFGQTLNFAQILTKRGIIFLILVAIAVGVYRYLRY